jgi:hypothetical protein
MSKFAEASRNVQTIYDSSASNRAVVPLLESKEDEVRCMPSVNILD